MEVRAHLRYLQIAPRKVRLVVDLVRGLPIDRALDQLAHLPKASAEPILKLVKSAMANAEHNFKLNRNDLVVKSIVANEGPRLKRYRPRAFGRAAVIQKRMSHITVILEDRGTTAKPGVKPAQAAISAVGKDTLRAAPAEPRTVTPPKVRTKPAAETKPRSRSAQDKEVPRKGES